MADFTVLKGLGQAESVVVVLCRELQVLGGGDEDFRALTTPAGEKFLVEVAGQWMEQRIRSRKDVSSAGSYLLELTDGNLPVSYDQELRDSELVFTLADGNEFLRDFAEVGGRLSCSNWLDQPAPNNSASFWPICDAGWSYEDLIPLVEKVPHWRWTIRNIQNIEEEFDVRQPKKRVLWTPVGLTAVQACPQYAGYNPRQILGIKKQVITCREAIILFLQIYWKHRIWLDVGKVSKTWTGSQSNEGHGVDIYSAEGKLSVGGEEPVKTNGEEPTEVRGGPRLVIKG